MRSMAADSELRMSDLVKAKPDEPGGPWFVELADGDSAFRFGPYANPSLAQQAAKELSDVLQRMLSGRVPAIRASN